MIPQNKDGDIYNSRNYVGVLAAAWCEFYIPIYNSRNYVGVLAQMA